MDQKRPASVNAVSEREKFYSRQVLEMIILGIAIILQYLLLWLVFKVPLAFIVSSFVIIAVFTLIFINDHLIRSRRFLENENRRVKLETVTIFQQAADEFRKFVNNSEGIIKAPERQELVNKFNALIRRIEELHRDVKNKPSSRLTAQENQELEARFGEIAGTLNQLNKQALDYVSQGGASCSMQEGQLRDAWYKMKIFLHYVNVMEPILSDFTEIFNEFSKKTIIDVIGEFASITEASQQIAGDIQVSMGNLMDSNKKDNLAFVIDETGRLSRQFEGFNTDMEALKKEWDDFTKNNSEKLESIRVIMDSIEQIAETIKVISLNVSIQAANAGENAKSFQILARDLREFTLRTVKFSKEVKEKVRNTLSSTETLKQEYLSKMGTVYNSLTDMSSSFHTFEGIARVSVDQIKKNIINVNSFSEKIDSDIKKIIGRLQYYDITSQELTHLKLFIGRIMAKYRDYQEGAADVVVEKEAKAEIQRTVLDIINDIITTASERKILDKYEKIFGLSIQADIDIVNKASKELKDEDNSIIVF